MTVKISCSSNESEALVHHMGSIGLAKETMAIEKITRGCARSRCFDMVLRVDATSFQFAILKVSTVLSSAELYG
jgi:hypothetical protein